MKNIEYKISKYFYENAIIIIPDFNNENNLLLFKKYYPKYYPETIIDLGFISYNTKNRTSNFDILDKNNFIEIIKLLKEIFNETKGDFGSNKFNFMHKTLDKINEQYTKKFFLRYNFPR